MAIEPSIALGVKPLQLDDPLAQYGKVAAIRQAQNQEELAQYQIQKMRQTDEGLRKIQALSVQNGGPEDLRKIAQTFMTLPDAEHQKLGLTILRELYNKKEFNRTLEALYPDLAAPQAGASPTNALAPQGAPAIGAPAVSAPAPAPGANALAATVAPETVPAAPANALVAPPAAPVVGAAAGKTPDQLRREIMLFSQSEDPRAKAMVAMLGKQLEEAQKTHTVGGQLVSSGGKVVYTAPSEFDRLLESSGLPEAEKTRLRIARATKEATHAPPAQTSVKVNTFVPASEEAQREFMKSSRATFDKLRDAPATLANIARARELIPTAKGFMGPGGESLKQAASFLNSRLGTSINVQGVKDASELQSRLFQGVIDNLRKVDAQPTERQQALLTQALGNIGTDPDALPQVLNVAEDIIRNRVTLYNEEVTGAEEKGVKFPYKPQIKIPDIKSEGTGAPAEAPAKAPAAKPTGRPAGVGANWTLEVDANGNKAYVSPDRKSFKEVK